MTVRCKKITVKCHLMRYHLSMNNLTCLIRRQIWSIKRLILIKRLLHEMQVLLIQCLLLLSCKTCSIRIYLLASGLQVWPSLLPTVLQEHLIKLRKAVIEYLLPLFALHHPSLTMLWHDWQLCGFWRQWSRRLWRLMLLLKFLVTLIFVVSNWSLSSFIASNLPTSCTFLVLNQFHLVLWNGALAVHPLPLDHVAIFVPHYFVHTLYVFKCHKTEPSRLLCTFIL